MTDRPVVPELEKILGQQIPVLDHGFVRVIDYMGDDGAVVQAARISYGRGTKQVSEDRGLINYLMRNRHTSPFEMCEIKFHIKMPIFVARQWIRHRTANVNEVSARYSVLDAEFYIPSPENLGSQSSENKQGRSEIIPSSLAEGILRTMKADAIQAFDHYDAFLSENLSRELARIGLPLSTYTQWYWKTNLHNLMHFLSLRADPHAQYEIRVYTDVILDILRQWVPLTHEAFLEYRMNAATISATGLAVIRRMLTGEPIELATSGMSSREWDEFMRILK